MKIELDISEPYEQMLEEMREEMPEADEQLSSRFETLIHKNYQKFRRLQSQNRENQERDKSLNKRKIEIGG